MIGAEGRLQNVEKKVRLLWMAVRGEWRDDKAREFEEEIIEPMLMRIRATERAMGHLSMTLQQARRDCE